MARHPSVDPSWERLAALLMKRRVDLDPRYRNRRTFCSEKEIEYRVISDIEGARRTNFSAPMITAIEVAYEIADGSIKAALADPSITQLPERQLRHPADRANAATTTDAYIPPSVSLPDLEPWEQHIWVTPGLTVSEREAVILLVRVVRGDLEDETPALLTLTQALHQALARKSARDQGRSTLNRGQGPPQAS